jgi:hypothetical protein
MTVVQGDLTGVVAFLWEKAGLVLKDERVFEEGGARGGKRRERTWRGQAVVATMKIPRRIERKAKPTSPEFQPCGSKTI